jgi:hypothetical protein
MYFIDNECLVCIAYQFGTSMGARVKQRPKRGSRLTAEQVATAAATFNGYGVVLCGNRTPAPVRACSESERQRADSSAVISLTADFASPKSIEVFGSK